MILDIIERRVGPPAPRRRVELATRASVVPTRHVVYFIRCGDRVKVGVSSQLQARMADLQVANPKRLELIGVIHAENQLVAKAIEREVHNLFSHVAARGEWFLDCEDLRTFVRENAMLP